jgi:hypothetical protein
LTRLAIGLTLSASLIDPFDVYGPGYLSATDPGILEAVASRRVSNQWGLTGDYTAYDVLVAPADCGLLGRSGRLITNGNVYSVIAVDCEQKAHRGQMAERGLLADVNRAELVHKTGWLVLR